MPSQLPEEERLLIWKLSEAYNHAVDLGLMSVAHIIKLALDEINDIADESALIEEKDLASKSDVGTS
ncbi:MAG: hypothetical protein ACTHLY_00990 [Pseudolabrys sp.]